jgi:hypothetical protein
MANKKVSIWLHCKTAKGWRYCRPVYGKNNKIKPAYAWVDGAEQHFPEAQYCLYYQETSGKRVWDKVAKNAALAVEMAETRQAYMQAKAAGVPVQDNAEIPVMFSYTLAPYLEEYKLTNRIESYNLMRQTLSEFRDFVKLEPYARFLEAAGSCTCHSFLADNQKEWGHHLFRPFRAGCAPEAKRSSMRSERM